MRDRLAAKAALAALAAAAGAAAGCGEDCCTFDSLPIFVARAPLGDGSARPGGLLGRATSTVVASGAPFAMVVDTGAPVTLLDTGTPVREIRHRAFDLLDAMAASPAPVRARFRDIGLLELPVGPVGADAVRPAGILGGDLLRAFSVELAFDVPCAAAVAPPAGAAAGCASMTLWRHFGASSGFLQDAGLAVVRFSLAGGGEVNALGDPDLFGLRGPLELPPTRVVLRACAAPAAFAPDGPRQSCGARGCEVSRASGVDLSLVLATGVGPLVLSESAWARLLARWPAGVPVPAMTAAPLLVATWPATIAGPGDIVGGVAPQPLWTSIPRLALVDPESGTNDDLGPCVDLARARRLEWVSYHQLHPELVGQPCVEICDTDPRETDKARNAAAYFELGGDLPVAVVADNDQFLQSLRADVRPEGPEIDGVLGAGALGRTGGGTHLDLDYRSTPGRAVFSCQGGSGAGTGAAAVPVDRATCFAAARCARLPDHDHTHGCYGLGPHGMPDVCTAGVPAVCDVAPAVP